jgi:GLPGLI family protein
MKNIIIIIIILFTANILLAQEPKIIKAGSVEYEKSVNVFALGRQMVTINANSSFGSIISVAFDQYQKNHPQFAVSKSNLVFSDNRSLFTPQLDDEVNGIFGNNLITKQFNTVYTDLSASKRITQKNVLGTDYLVTDSMSKIKWRITGGTQEVAGYTCREAHGVIQDSVYLVAFYTDRIWLSGGPESFSGLPGMILKLAIPHEHVAWTATKVVQGVASTAIEPPKKGKPMTGKELTDLLKKLAPYMGLKIIML